MYSFFKTAKGSTYTMLPNGRTVRTKHSAGNGQGETDMQSNNCLFVSAEVANEDLAGPNAVGLSYRLGYCELHANGSPKAFQPFGDTPVVPKGAKAAVAIYFVDQLIRLHQAHTVPAVGLHPVEHRYEGNKSIRHVGNPIVAIQKISL